MASGTIKRSHEIYHKAVNVTTDNVNGRSVTIQDDHILATSCVIVREKYATGNDMGWFFIQNIVGNGSARFYAVKHDGTWPTVNTPISLDVLIVN